MVQIERRSSENKAERGEELILVGDLNKAVGNDEFGVEGNHPKISFGGSLVRSLISSGQYILINNTKKCTGGPFTWTCSSNPEIRSCLDLVIVN